MIVLAVLLGDAPLLWAAWRANRRTTLTYTLTWTAFAWAAWLWWAVEGALGGATTSSVRYAALCLTSCAGMMVLGARRPGASAWSFVTLGLLAVLLRPLLEGLGELRLEGPHLFFLAMTLLVGVINYLPTRLGPAALLLGVGCGLEVAWLGERLPAASPGPLLLALTPWLAWVMLRARRPATLSALNRVWLDFRDRFGLVWAQRVREQLNRAAVNAGWPVVLSWKGLQTPQGAPAQETPEQLAGLRALLKRFSLETVGPQDEPAKKPG